MAPATVFNKAKMAPFVPGGEALFYEPRTGDPRHDEPRAFCMPSGFPSAFLGPYPVQFIQTPQHLVMSTEFMNVTRIIPLDGRPHKTDIEPTFYGEPVGRWEGDTLVIEAQQLQALVAGRLVLPEPEGVPHAHRGASHHRAAAPGGRQHHRLRVHGGRSRRSSRSPGRCEWEMKRHPEWEKTGLYEMVCNENNRCEGGKCRDSK